MRILAAKYKFLCEKKALVYATFKAFFSKIGRKWRESSLTFPQTFTLTFRSKTLPSLLNATAAERPNEKTAGVRMFYNYAFHCQYTVRKILFSSLAERTFPSDQCTVQHTQRYSSQNPRIRPFSYYWSVSARLDVRVICELQKHFSNPDVLYFGHQLSLLTPNWPFRSFKSRLNQIFQL